MLLRTVAVSSMLCLGLPLVAEQMDPVSLEDALDTFHVPPGLELQLVAAEPVIEDPVALAFDETGRLFVVENRGYPSDEEKNGRVSVLRDKDGDGYYESRTTFADGFAFPNGVMPWKGGVLVTSAPTVYFLKDTDGDDVADVREDFLTGFKLGGSTQLYVSHPTLGLDNWLYFTNGLSGGEVVDPRNPDAAPLKMGTNDLRYNPVTGTLEATAGRAQFGQAFDSYGHRFVCTNRKHIAQVLVQQADLARNPYAGLHEVEDEIAGKGSETRLFALSDATTTAYSHAGTFSAACGLSIYRGTALPAEYHDNGFTCDPTSNVIHRTVLSGEGPAYEGRRGREGVEFLATTDNWSRPVFTANGPDGALYFCDMYRKTIEHPQYLPKDVIAVTDFQSGRNMGRIYRIVPEGTSSGTPPLGVSASNGVSDLIGQLAAKDSWQRESAHRIILTESARTPELIAALRETLQHGSSEHARLHGLYLLQGLDALEEGDLITAMADSASALREHGIRLARPQIARSAGLRGAITQAATDGVSRVRYYAALALGDLNTPETVAPLLEVARRDLNDPWIRTAVFSGINEQLLSFASAFLVNIPAQATGVDVWVGPLARMIAQSQPSEASGEVLALLLEGAVAENPEWLLTALEGMAEGIRRNRAYDGATPSMAHMSALVDGAPAGTVLSDVIAQSRAWVSDSSTSLPVRLHAIRIQGYGSFAEGGELLAGLLNPQEPQDIHEAAVQALGMMNDPGVATLLAKEEAWRLYSTPIRKAALATLLSRPERVAVLLDAMESGSIQAWSIDPVSRRRLTSSKDESLKARAVEIFSKVEKSDRNAVYEDYKSIFALDADPVAGREVFKNNCARCHKFSEDGYEVGPDLTGIRSQPRESILLHIIKPNSEVLAGFENFVVETNDLESYSGIMVAENESTVTIRGALGVENTINREDIETMSSASLSLMPEELEKVMSKQDMRNLIGFLKGEK